MLDLPLVHLHAVLADAYCMAAIRLKAHLHVLAGDVRFLKVHIRRTASAEYQGPASGERHRLVELREFPASREHYIQFSCHSEILLLNWLPTPSPCI